MRISLFRRFNIEDDKTKTSGKIAENYFFYLLFSIFYFRRFVLTKEQGQVNTVVPQSQEDIMRCTYIIDKIACLVMSRLL